ncbi:hypothetical protein [Desulfosporosinus hippei]|uniref:Uncharacterized protein n=1 Tax=Desulfosporosinus hippei DSM 8344 TaxID=1121419 RepID=A0A1G8ALS5_9FIRM|nr:hypothetical protein [Desulfosporosinus hippei]SDH21809.1 hypothetical protein SAMN05443529_11146 [Desulfosporosinus hippei DSM 8344]
MIKIIEALCYNIVLTDSVKRKELFNEWAEISDWKVPDDIIDNSAGLVINYEL